MSGQHINDWINDIHVGNALSHLRDLPTNSLHMVMVSPPDWNPRDTGDPVRSIWTRDPHCDHDWAPITADPSSQRNTSTDESNSNGLVCLHCDAWKGEFGREPSYEMYVNHLVLLGHEIRRVLRPDGSWWLNLGDAYTSPTTGAEKSKVFLPHQTAIALSDDGWIVRNNAVWAKTNPTPESVTDRLTPTFEFIFHLVPEQDYFYDLDAIREPYKENTVGRAERGRDNTNKYAGGAPGQTENTLCAPADEQGGLHALGKNPGDIFELPIDPSSTTPVTVSPEDLCIKPIKATCPPKTCGECGTPYTRRDSTSSTSKGSAETNSADQWKRQCSCSTSNTLPGIVLDPMCGRGTTCKVASELGRRYIGIDINPECIRLATEFIPKE